MLLLAVVLSSVNMVETAGLQSAHCEVVTSHSVNDTVELVFAEPNKVTGLERVGDLVGAWISRCPIADRAERQTISRSVSRLLVRPELRSHAAIILYQLGEDAAVSRVAIHSAYLQEKRAFTERSRDGFGIRAGSEVRDSLRCLDLRLRGARPSLALCRFLESFPNPERKMTTERG